MMLATTLLVDHGKWVIFELSNNKSNNKSETETHVKTMASWMQGYPKGYAQQIVRHLDNHVLFHGYHGCQSSKYSYMDVAPPTPQIWGITMVPLFR